MSKEYGKIGVLMGGHSSEREISLKSGKAVLNALKEERCDVVPIDIIEEKSERIASFISSYGIDIAFIALHGRLGEDGKIQTILENLDIPYTGSGIKASRLAINKIATQNFLKNNGINVPSYVSLIKNEKFSFDSLAKELSLPVVVKPASEGSSIGIHIVQQRDELGHALQSAWEHDDQLIIEEYIRGREFTVGILEKEPLAVIEVVPKRSFFDFTAKYEQGMTEYIVPAEISPKTTVHLQQVALKVHNIIGCSDLSRIDFMIDEQGREYVLELNTIPGFTSTSLVPKAAKIKGLSFNQLCLKLIELTYGKKEKIKNTTVRS